MCAARRLVTSVPLVLPQPNHLLRLPPLAGLPPGPVIRTRTGKRSRALADLLTPASARLTRAYLFPHLPGAQLRYSIRLGADQLPVALTVPAQTILPEQSLSPDLPPLPAITLPSPCPLPLRSDLFATRWHGAVRRWYWGCPGCGRWSGRLYLADPSAPMPTVPASPPAFLCRRCSLLWHPNPAHNLIRALRQPRLTVRFAPVLIQWSKQGKGRKSYWPAPVPTPTHRYQYVSPSISMLV